MRVDSKSLDRTAQVFIVEARRGYGSPPDYESDWQPVWNVKVDHVEINHADKFSIATIWFPEFHWNEDVGLTWGDMVRIRTEHNNSTVIFQGFLTNYLSDFSGGTEKIKAFERNAVVCCDYRWLLSVTSSIFGQYARTADDTESSVTSLSGRRTIFNAQTMAGISKSVKPNRDPAPVVVDGFGNVPVFADPDIAVPWTARDMLAYIMCPAQNRALKYFPLIHPDNIPALEHEDWDKVLNHIVVDGLNIIEAITLICKHLGWSFREDYTLDGPQLTFYKIGAASGYVRDDDNPVILHQLHCPAVDEFIDEAVSQGKKMLHSASFAEDIAAVVNNPWGLGAPDQFEFTAELVPAWLDGDLVPDTSEGMANLCFTEAELQDMDDPDSKSFYAKYHRRGNSFIRNVGRRWSLNESGRYSAAPTEEHPDAYDRGMPFDFKTVIPPEYILDSRGSRLYAPFNRQLLPALTVDKDSLSSVGIKVEFSFDAGETWQVIPASIISLKDECGIYIEEANLAEIVDKKEGTISGGDLDGIQLNYWTSLCDDILNKRDYKSRFLPSDPPPDPPPWKTRIRVTASIQLDRRLVSQSQPSSASGSPFWQTQVYDFSDRYKIQKQTISSVFKPSVPPAAGDLTAWEIDSTAILDKHLQSIRDANQDLSISGRFTLERLWLGDGSGSPDFAVGDCIEKITGREYSLAAALAGKKIYPEIIQIVYLPDNQQTQLITRDLRFADVRAIL